MGELFQTAFAGVLATVAMTATLSTLQALRIAEADMVRDAAFRGPGSPHRPRRSVPAPPSPRRR